MVKKMKAKLKTPSITNVAVLPIAPSTMGNTVVMMAFEIQFDAVEQVMPKSLPLKGWISEQSTQIRGPADAAKPTMKIITAPTVT